MFQQKLTKAVKTATPFVVLVISVIVFSGCLEPQISFQGRLTDSSGDPLNGTYTMTVRFLPSVTGGTPLFTETKQVEVTDGLFNREIDGFPPHIFSAGLSQSEELLYMEVDINGETLTPRRPVAGAAYAHALVAGSGIVGARPDPANVTDDGFGAALTVINTEQGNPGYGLMAKAGNAAVFADNQRGDGSLNPSPDAADNPDIILGSQYIMNADGDTATDTDGGPGVISTDPDESSSDMHLRSNDAITMYRGYDETFSTASSEFVIVDNASGITPDPELRLDGAGDLSIDGSYSTGGADYAELIDVEGAETDYEPGDVLVISDEQDRAVELADSANSSRVIGVYSANPGLVGGAHSPEEQKTLQESALALSGLDVSSASDEQIASLTIDDGAVEVAIAGIVPVKVSAENGPIQRGDLLTTSDTPGHAMKTTTLTPGAILGKAMGTLDSGTGVIEVLVLLQ